MTWRSAMHSSSADWVFGEARLISSAITTLANTGPGRNSNSAVCRLKIDMPVMSPGSRSGVNCTRLTEQSIERASALASDVLPTPGTSSTSRWPSASSVTSARRTTSGLPTMHALDVARRCGAQLGDLGQSGGPSAAVRAARSRSLLVVVTDVRVSRRDAPACPSVPIVFRSSARPPPLPHRRLTVPDTGVVGADPR